MLMAQGRGYNLLICVIWLCVQLQVECNHLALNKTTSSSSVYQPGGFGSQLAADANIVVIGDDYFKSQEAPYQWWSVDLGDLYFITEIKVYNVHSQYERLQQLYILMSYFFDPGEPQLDQLPEQPPEETIPWFRVLYSRDPLSSSLQYPDNYFKFATNSSVPLIIHIAVYSDYEGGLAINEVEVTGVQVTKFRPTQLRWTSNVSCVFLSWEPPSAGINESYQARYNNNDTWMHVGHALSTVICDFPSYTLVACDVEVERAAGYASVLARTACAAPSAPTSIRFHYQIRDYREERIGRVKLLYLVTWQPPAEYNCWNITSYNTRFVDSQGGTNSSSATTNSILVETDGDVDVTFNVSAVNNANLESEYTTLTFRTAAFRPQVAPQSVRLIAVNTECVQLSWRPPEYPNGLITSYQYICNTLSDWVTVPASENVDMICNLQPNQAVECMVMAVNSIGLSDGANSTATTPCAAPRLRDDWSNYITEEAYIPDGSLYHRRRFNVNVPSEVIDENCNSITSIVFGFRQMFASTIVNITNNAYIDNLNASVLYTIYFTVRNNGNFETTERAYITTGELEPGLVHLNYQLIDEKCVSVNWSEPDPPNGRVLDYDQSCVVDGAPDQPVTVEIYTNRAIRACVDTPGVDVTCQVKGSTVIGFGPPSEITVRVGHALSAPVNVYPSQRTTDLVKLIWQPPAFNYQSLEITEYIVKCRVANNMYNSRAEIGSTREHTSSVTYLTIRHLPSQVQYNCTIQASASNELSVPAYLQFWTRPNEVSFRWPSEEASPAQTTVTIPLPIIVSDPALLAGYSSMWIVVQSTRVGQGSGLTPYSVDGINAYVAADLPPSQLNSSFVVGDGQKYGNYDRNKPLGRGVYNIYIGFIAQTEDVVTRFIVIPGAEAISVPIAPPTEGGLVFTVTPPRPRSKANAGAIAAGVIVGVLIIVCLILTVLYLRKRTSCLNRQQPDAYHHNIGSAGESYMPLGVYTIRDGNKPSFDKLT